MISVPPSASLYDAVSLLIKVRSCKLLLGLHCLKNLKVKFDKICSNFQNKIHRLPVVDPENGNVLYILNQKPLLRSRQDLNSNPTKLCHQVLPSSFIKKTATRFLYHYVPNLAGSPHLGISIAEANVGSYNDIQVKQKNLWKQALTREKTLVVNNLSSS